MSDFVQNSDYVELFPLSRAHQALWMSMLAPTWPPTQSDAPWRTQGGEFGNLREVNSWYTAEKPGFPDFSAGAYYTFEGNPATEDNADVWYSDEYQEVFFSARRFGEGAYISAVACVVFDLTPLAGMEFERAEIVVDSALVNAIRSVSDPIRDDPDDMNIGIRVLSGVTSFGDDVHDHRVVLKDTPGGYDVTRTFTQEQSGSLHDTVDVWQRDVFPLPRIPSGVVTSVFSIFPRSGVVPEATNSGNFLMREDRIAGVENDGLVDGDWHSIMRFDMPAIRLWFGGGQNMIDARGQARLYGQVRTYQEREVLHHRARLRRGGA